jgi:hypothetical protein
MWPQVAAHVRDALRMQKPLLISDLRFAPPTRPPPSGEAAAVEGADADAVVALRRQARLQQVVLGYLADAAQRGMPIAGGGLRPFFGFKMEPHSD